MGEVQQWLLEPTFNRAVKLQAADERLTSDAHGAARARGRSPAGASRNAGPEAGRLGPSPGDKPDRLTIEQVRSAMDVWLNAADLPPAARRRRYEEELKEQHYYQRRNHQAHQSHTNTKLARLQALGIDIHHIKSCITDTTET